VGGKASAWRGELFDSGKGALREGESFGEVRGGVQAGSEPVAEPPESEGGTK